MAGQPITRAKKQKAAKHRAEREANGGKRITRNPTPPAKRAAKKKAAEEAGPGEVDFGGHTKEAWQSFVAEFLNTGRQDLACKKAGIPRETVYKRKRNDTEFAKIMEEAREICMDSLEDAAIKRGRDGWLEPVFFKGEFQGNVRKYSDSLLTFMLIHGRPEKFRPKKDVELNVNPASNPPTINLTLNGSRKTEEAK